MLKQKEFSNGIRASGNSRFIECDSIAVAEAVFKMWQAAQQSVQRTGQWVCLHCGHVNFDSTLESCGECEMPRR